MFRIKCWWNPREDEIKHTGVKKSVRCINCGKGTMIDVDIMNTTYKDIITTFVLNIMLYHVGMLWIIEKHTNNYNMICKNKIQNG